MSDNNLSIGTGDHVRSYKNLIGVIENYNIYIIIFLYICLKKYLNKSVKIFLKNLEFQNTYLNENYLKVL